MCSDWSRLYGGTMARWERGGKNEGAEKCADGVVCLCERGECAGGKLAQG